MSQEHLTLEELARRAEVPLQRLSEWEGLGLLRRSAGGFDADSLERARLLRFATERGISIDDIAAANEREGRDVLGRFLEYLGRPGGPGCSIEEAATLLGLDEAFLRRVWIAGGLGDRDEWLFEEDLEAMRAVAMALEAGLPEEALVQIVRVMADALGRVADGVTRLFHFYVHERLHSEGLAPEVATAGTQEASDALTGLVEPSILYVHRKAWVRAMREDLVLHLAEDVAPADAPVAQLPVAVLFVDLASFTPLTEAMGRRGGCGGPRPLLRSRP